MCYVFIIPSLYYGGIYTLYNMSNCRKFLTLNVDTLLRDALALWLAVGEEDDIGVRQLLREFECSYPKGYGKQVTVKMLPLLNKVQHEWLRTLY